jgi:hypothetical protein
MTIRVPYVSVVDPIGPAIERVKMVLFRPFSFERWIVIGFCAWLAFLVERGGGGGGGGGSPNGIGRARPDIQQGVNHARDWLTANLYWIGPVAVILVVAVIAIILVIAWLRSRGQFMFLYCVAQNKAEVKNPWRLFRRHGNSLFAFRIVFGIIATLVMAGLIGLGVATFFMAHGGYGFNVVTLSAMIGCGVLLIVAMIIAGVVAKFTRDFVVPIMYLHTPSCVQGWRILLDLLAFNKARFVLYILFQIVIHLAIAAVVFMIGCLTCCCAFCILAIPYVGTVLYLPVLVFLQSYPLYYLAQYGPEFNAIAPAPQMAPPASPPMPQP